MSSEKIEIPPEVQETMNDMFRFQRISEKAAAVEKALEGLMDAISDIPEGHHAYEIADEVCESCEPITEMVTRMLAGWWFSMNGYSEKKE